MLASSSMHSLLACTSPPSYSQARGWKAQFLSASYYRRSLDRVNVLGSESTGHSGCVNALSWANGGEILISSGDDRTVRLWRMDKDDTGHDYPFVCNTVIQTGHRANVFNAQMLPHSSRVATVAGDCQVRVSDPQQGSSAGISSDSGVTEYSTRAAVIRVLRCHDGRVKRIVTEDSPDLFLTVSEDGSVRQHDLRVPHSCSTESCPAPLVQVNHVLSTIAISPLTPYQFVVAGSSPYGYLFDRRHAGRQFQEEWGVPPDIGTVTTCVRRFVRASRGQHERKGHEHITGVRMACSNGHEVLISYSADAIYLYSTNDDPLPTTMAAMGTSIVPLNRNHSHDRHTSQELSDRNDRIREDTGQIIEECASSAGEHQPLLGEVEDVDEDPDIRQDENDGEDDDDEEDENSQGDKRFGEVPFILPRSRFEGVCNVETVKDVNFLGPLDEFVVSGSDDGNWFMWEKETGRLHDILEGDGSVVNVIEGHPHLPLVAVSGIDNTVKLFAPSAGPSQFSQMHKAAAIVSRNATAAAPLRNTLSDVVLYYRLARRMAGNSQEGIAPECAFQ